MRMRRIILCGVMVAPVVPFGLVLLIGHVYFTRILETGAVSGMKRVVEDHRVMIDTFLNERKNDLKSVISTYGFEDLQKPGALKQVFATLRIQADAFVDIGVFDEKGIHVAYHGPYHLSGMKYGDAEWFVSVMEKGEYISDVFLGYRQSPHFVIALLKIEGTKQWVIRATVDTYRFSNLVRGVQISNTGEAYILNCKGIFQTERRSGGNLMEKDPDFGKYAVPVETAVNTFVETDFSGRAFLYAITKLNRKNWILVARQEKKEAFQEMFKIYFLISLVIVIGGVIIVLMALLLTSWIVYRIRESDEEKDRLEEQLIRAGRLAELGEMAAGFAHEINNPLQIMKSEHALMEMNFSEMQAKGDIRNSPEFEEILDSLAQVKQQIGRCADITQSILKFGRKTGDTSQVIDLQTFLPEAVHMIENRAAVSGIQISLDIDPSTPGLMLDAAKLQQALLNLFNNAMDAIIEKHGIQGGELTLTAKPAPEDMVEIRVMDNGCGISEENQEKIFSPFYTTKPVGKGTGLGLSVCFGIIRHMHGKISVESRVGEGTTFILLLGPTVSANQKNTRGFPLSAAD